MAQMANSLPKGVAYTVLGVYMENAMIFLAWATRKVKLGTHEHWKEWEIPEREEPERGSHVLSAHLRNVSDLWTMHVRNRRKVAHLRTKVGIATGAATQEPELQFKPSQEHDLLRQRK